MNVKRVDQLAVVMLYTADQPILEEVFQLIADGEFTIADARVVAKASELSSLSLLLSGSWNQLARFESRFSILERRYNFHALVRRSNPKPYPKSALPYIAYIIALDTPDVVSCIIGFLTRSQVQLNELNTIAYEAPITHTNMLGISLAFLLPSESSVSDFREHLIIFCDEHNFEVTMEPQKN